MLRPTGGPPRKLDSAAAGDKRAPAPAGRKLDPAAAAQANLLDRAELSHLPKSESVRAADAGGKVQNRGPGRLRSRHSRPRRLHRGHKPGEQLESIVWARHSGLFSIFRNLLWRPRHRQHPDGRRLSNAASPGPEILQARDGGHMVAHWLRMQPDFLD